MRTILTLSIFLLVCTAVLHLVVFTNNFNRDIGNWLKLAGDAPTVELADEYLGNAIKGIQNRQLTSGSSAYMFHNPNADLAIWYKNIAQAKNTTQNILQGGESIAQLEKDNALMKIREVVLDTGSDGTKVTTPPNIVIHPYQWAFLVCYLLSMVGIFLGIIGRML